jgi:hypothetical protein
MKKILILSIVLMISGISLLAQAPPTPPENPSNGGGGPVGGGAPIGSGLVLLISLAAGYGGKKVYNAMKKLVE